MKNSLLKFTFRCILLGIFITQSNFVSDAIAIDGYSYGFQVDPVVSRFVVKPKFEAIESRVSIKNTGDDALFQISSSEKTKSIDTTVLYLDNDQKWSPVTAPILIKENEAKTITLVIKSSKPKINEGDYYIETKIAILPTYIPLTLSKYLQIKPGMMAKTTISITNTGYTKILPKVAHFTNLTGNVIMSNTEPKIVLLVQNLDKYSLFVKGNIQIKKDGVSESIDILPTNIEANNQSYLTNVTNSNEKIVKLNKTLSWGKYSLYAQVYTANTSTPTIFASYDLWVIPIGTVYFLSILLIAMLVSLFFYHFFSTKKYG